MIYTVRQRIQEVFGHYDRHVPADVIKGLFVVIPNDETTLTQEIMGYLLEHNYEALKTPEGQSLRERLISTDWRQKQENQSVAEPQPLPIATDVSVHPVSIPLSQSNKVLVALVIGVASILLWLWKGKLTEIDRSTSRVEVVETAPAPTAPITPGKEITTQSNADLIRGRGPHLSVLETPVVKKADNAVNPAAKTVQPIATEGSEKDNALNTSAVKPYDSVDNRVGDFGLRAARKGAKWGYVDQKEQWHIEPIYDDVTPFQNGKAIVMLDGQQISIDRDGARIREDE